MTRYKRRPIWRRNKATHALVERIRIAIQKAGYEMEHAIVPLSTTFSVLVNQGENVFNVRLDKTTLQIIRTDELKYHRKRDNIRLVFRQTV